MKHFNVRDRLIENTIKVIASEGLENTTTKAIVRGTDLNEAYIYRVFADKEDLLAAVYETLDVELFNVSMSNVEVMYDESLPYEDRCRAYFNAVWKFLLQSREKCIAYIRYFYSPYFRKYSHISHGERFAPLLARFKDAFREEANVWMLLNHVLNVMLDFALKVHGSEVPGDADTEEHVYRLVYFSVSPYFKQN